MRYTTVCALAFVVAGCAAPRPLYLKNAQTGVLWGPVIVNSATPITMEAARYVVIEATPKEMEVDRILRTTRVSKDFREASVEQVVAYLNEVLRGAVSVRVNEDPTLKLAAVFDIYYPAQEVGGELRPIRNDQGQLPRWYSLPIFTTSMLSNVRPPPSLLQYLDIVGSMCGIRYAIRDGDVWIEPDSANQAPQDTSLRADPER